jgi:hypothetical protein
MLLLYEWLRVSGSARPRSWGYPDVSRARRKNRDFDRYRSVRFPPTVKADRQVVRQMDARYRPGVDMGGIEQCKEGSFRPAIETLNN